MKQSALFILAAALLNKPVTATQKRSDELDELIDDITLEDFNSRSAAELRLEYALTEYALLEKQNIQPEDGYAINAFKNGRIQALCERYLIPGISGLIIEGLKNTHGISEEQAVIALRQLDLTEK